MQRRGVTSVMLNAIIGLLITASTLSVAFFVYTSFMQSITSSQVTKGFTDFIKPIEVACQKGGTYTGTGASLPTTGGYTYGIFQTRINSMQPGMPITMSKCQGSYCLCLFRLEEPTDGYYFWDTTPGRFTEAMTDALGSFLDLDIDLPSTKGEPAPLWHFDRAGVAMFPPLIARMVQSTIIKTVLYIGFHIFFVKVLLPKISCSTACTGASGGLAVALCEPACNAGIYAIMYALRNAATAFLTSLIEEVSEPFLLVNYPANFMSIPGDDGGPKDEKYLEWNCPSSNYDDCYISELSTNLLSAGDWQSIGASVAEAALDGFIDGMFAGLAKGGTASSAATGFFRKAMTKSLKLAAIGLVQTWSLYERMELKKASGIAALQFDMPSSFRPAGYVSTLLSHRRILGLDEFVTISWGEVFTALDIASVDIVDLLEYIISGPAQRIPAYTVTTDSQVTDFNGFDVVNCVSISELGPLCDSETKVLMDYDHDLYMSYRITDPINHPEKAIFCGYNGAKGGMDINIITIVADYAKKALKGESVSEDAEDEDEKWYQKVWNAVVDFFIDTIASFTDLVIGEWLLAGMTNMQGLFMECVQQHYRLDYRSEYFQYWVPYSDNTGLTGTTGNIGAIIATNVPQDSDVNACKSGYIQQWSNCYNLYNNWKVTGTYTTPVTATHSLSTLLDAESAVCPWDGNSQACASGSLPSEQNISCIDVYHPQYLGCNKGIHLKFAGVLQ